MRVPSSSAVSFVAAGLSKLAYAGQVRTGLRSQRSAAGGDGVHVAQRPLA